MKKLPMSLKQKLEAKNESKANYCFEGLLPIAVKSVKNVLDDEVHLNELKLVLDVDGEYLEYRYNSSEFRKLFHPEKDSHN